MKNIIMKKCIVIGIFFLFAGISMHSIASNDNKYDEYYQIGDDAELKPLSWWNVDWSYKKAITINESRVFDNLTNFPLLINIVDDDLTTYAQVDGDDIVFTDDMDMKLNHEIECYNDTTGSLVAWVNVPNLSSTTPTILYMYYGNPDAENQENLNETWDNNYLAVHHLEETSGMVYDSTANDNDGTPQGDMDQDVAGIINGADYFDGDDDHIILPQVYENETQFTWEAWIYPQVGSRYFISQWNDYQGSFLQVGATPDRVEWYIDDSGVGYWGISLETWYHIVATYDGSTARIYCNGGTPVSEELNTTIWTNDSMFIGDRSTGDRQFHGIIDEVRLSNNARSLEWINTCYVNQQDPTNFTFLDEQEEIPNPNLHCIGSLSWVDVEPGSTIHGTFNVANVGDQGSELNWDIIFEPVWGSWTFTPDSGEDLKPEDGLFTVEVEIVAPTEEETEFDDEIQIINRDDPSDYCTIDVSLVTPVSQGVYSSLIYLLLERLIQQFPILEKVLSLLNI